MNHKWWEEYIGREYIVDEYDCVHLLVDVQQNVFGHEFSIPVERERHLINKSAQIQFHLDEYTTPIEEADISDGDMLLMKCKGVLNHTGIVAIHNDVPYVLHNLRNIKSVAMHKIRELENYGMVVDGYYRFRTESE